jgi:hypothetical protein
MDKALGTNSEGENSNPTTFGHLKAFFDRLVGQYTVKKLIDIPSKVHLSEMVNISNFACFIFEQIRH